jgi:hypothetical protein
LAAGVWALAAWLFFRNKRRPVIADMEERPEEGE